jgi:uncharacterized membrane protein
MVTTLKLFFTAIIGFLVIDYVWLNIIAKKFYMTHMSEVGRFENGQFQPILWAAAVVYLILTLGVIYFILPGVAESQTYVNIFIRGALLGLIIYGVYDMTNLSTLKSWPIPLALADMVWGAVLTGAVSVITFFVQKL